MAKFLGLILFLFSLSAVAEVGYFLSAKTGTFSVDDPEGDTDSDNVFVPGMKITYDLASRGSRAFVGYDHFDGELDGSVENIGQEIEGYMLSFGYEKKFPLTRNLSVWLGGALTYHDHEYKNRFTIDSEGFLDELFDNRSEQILGVALSADSYFEITESIVFGVGAFADMTAGDGLNVFGLRLTVGKQ